MKKDESIGEALPLSVHSMQLERSGVARPNQDGGRLLSGHTPSNRFKS